jgi:hypothetical protein
VGNPESVEAMRTAADRLLERLDGDAGATVRTAFADTTARKDWHYVPRRRAGLSLAAMAQPQAKAAYDLLATALSVPGLATATAIIALEDVLDRLEGGHRHRHHRDYSVTVFDDPGASDPWGWRFEGHHVSVNVTVVDGEVAASPLFLGANPTEVLGPGGHPITRPLAAEEDLALALFGAMTPEQRDAAVLGDQAPDDILTAAAPDLLADGVLPETAGVAFGDLTGAAAELAEGLVRLYLDRLAPDLAAAWWQRLAPGFGDVRLAVAGQAGHRLPQYYRLHGPALFVEYDNTQDDANHVHTVLRDPEGDFGEDRLRAHRHDHHRS